MAFFIIICYNEVGEVMYSNELVCMTIEYINENINKEITIDELSMLFYFDKTYIMKRFKKEIGVSIHEYINIIRIYNSLSLFKTDNYFLSIGMKNGFNSLEYFSETFKKVIGVNPTTYKKYISYKYISKKEESLILDNINHISNVKTKAINFLNHRKPKTLPTKMFKL